jgi:hypothetical protein
MTSRPDSSLGRVDAARQLQSPEPFFSRGGPGDIKTPSALRRVLIELSPLLAVAIAVALLAFAVVNVP